MKWKEVANKVVYKVNRVIYKVKKEYKMYKLLLLLLRVKNPKRCVLKGKYTQKGNTGYDLKNTVGLLNQNEIEYS